jgi:hypothetical protein
MRPVLLSLLIFSLLTASSVHARDIKATGIGVQACSNWNAWKAAKNGELRAMALEWSFGMIAGHNVYSPTTSENPASVVVDSKVLTALLDSFCEKYPEQRLLSAVLDIVQSLGGAKMSAAPKTQGGQATPGAPTAPGTIRPPVLDPKRPKGTSL